MDCLMISDEIKALEFARFLVERGAKNNLLEDGTPNMQRAILGCHLITQLMSKLHMMGTLHVSESRVEKMHLIIGEKIQDAETHNILLQEIKASQEFINFERFQSCLMQSKITLTPETLEVAFVDLLRSSNRTLDIP